MPEKRLLRFLGKYGQGWMLLANSVVQRIVAMNVPTAEHDQKFAVNVWKGKSASYFLSGGPSELQSDFQIAVFCLLLSFEYLIESDANT